MTPQAPKDYILLRQQREERTSKAPDGALYPHAVIDFIPVLDKKQQPIVYHQVEHASTALTAAKQQFPHHLIAIQPLTEYLECHQKPTPSQRFPRANGQKPGR